MFDAPTREEDLFQARLIGRDDSGDGPLYTWVELYIDPKDGSLSEQHPARSGTAARELNDAVVDVEGRPLVWMRLRGFTAGGPVYEFDAGGLRFVGAVSLARVTDPDPDAGGRYAAVLATLDPDDGTPADGDEVLLLSPDGEDLLEGRYYEVVYQGRDADDEPVWAAGAGRPVLARVTDGTPDGDGLYAAVLTVWDGATWSDGAEVLLLPANDEELAEGERYQATFQSRDEDSPAVWAAAPGSGSGSLTVEKMDWVGGHTVSDTRTGIGTIQLTEYSGLTYEQIISGTPPAGTVRLEGKAANGTVWGLVIDQDQHWIGTKYINQVMEFRWDPDYSTYPPASAPSGSPFWTDYGSIHRNAPVCVVCGVYSRDDELGTDHDLRGRIELFAGSSISQEAGVTSFAYKTEHKGDFYAIAARDNSPSIYFPSTALCFFRPNTDGLCPSDSGGVGIEFADDLISLFGPSPQIRMYVDGVEHGGKTGTLSDGTEVTGGVITDIDDGSGFFTGTVP